MKVLYHQELARLAVALQAMGFEMQPLAEDATADAILFASVSKAAMKTRPAPGGTLLLNARGMSAAEAAQALRRKTQTPLFP